MSIIRLETGRSRALIAPLAGGRIAQIEVFDGARWLPLLHEAAARAGAAPNVLGWGSFVMAPWPNRIANSRFCWRGREFELPVSRGSEALHGLVYDREWSVEGVSDTSTTLAIDLGPPWPWRGGCVQRIDLMDDGLRQQVTVEAHDDPFPAGIGWHPWFRRDAGGGPVSLRVAAGQRHQLSRMIPTGRLLDVTGEYDLRAGPVLGDRRLDACYQLTGTMTLDWGSLRLTMRSSPNAAYAVVYTPEHAVCVEPQTCAIDAFNLEARGLAAGVAVAAPGQPLAAWTEWRWQTAKG